MRKLSRDARRERRVQVIRLCNADQMKLPYAL